MTIKTINEHAYEIVTEEGTFAVRKDTLAKFDATKHEHGVAACGCCFTGDCCDDTDCEHNHTEECEGKACLHACHENHEGHECAFCHLAFDTNSEGQVIIDGKDIPNHTAHQLTDYRRTDIGFVFQFYNLVANLTAKENVELASEIVHDAQDPTQALTNVGLQDRINNFPAQLSGGEQQRVAIARAVARTRRFCCATSGPALWTATPASRCCRFCRIRAVRRARPWSL